MVYVDQLVFPRKGILYCHLTADSIEELHAFADRIGIKRCWFENHAGKHHPHYDLHGGFRSRALKLGAQEVGMFAYPALVYFLHYPYNEYKLTLFNHARKNS